VSRSRFWPRTSELDALIAAARNGSPGAVGKLLASCRDYLLLVANHELGRDLQGKIGASDLVQETFVEAQRCFVQFQGASQSELLGWLRQILMRQVLGVRRYYGTVKRDISLERSCSSDSAIQQAVESLPCVEQPPEHGISAAEDATVLCRALDSLPDDYRQVIALRYWENLDFDEIGQRMGRSAAAARKLWLRAVERLELGGGLGNVEP
jgi:RNA polymerase sigma-70 factor (ECF subfamily)